jgi:peptide/nickel transport system substrate-binding protein
MTFKKFQILYLFIFALFSFQVKAIEALTPFGVVKLQETPAHTNINAPQAGQLTTGVQGSFDSLNPFVSLGVSAPNIRMHQFESLLMRRHDAPFALVPQIAKSFNLEGTQLHFMLDERAKFSDNSPITPQDIINSWRILKEKGRPNLRQFYGQVKKVEVQGTRITFHLLSQDDPELPLLIGLMPIIKADFAGFGENRLTPLIGSGPYQLKEIKIGESLTFQKNPNWWGKVLPQNKGFHNLERYKYDFYRDSTALLEAFRKGLVDWRLENDPAKWKDLQTWPNIERKELKLGVPLPFKSLFINSRKETFKDARVRRALALLLDVKWINEQLYSNMMQPLSSLFEGSELQGVTHSQQDTQRARLSQALTLFKDAGFSLNNGKLLNVQKQPFSFEILVQTKESERIALAYISQVKRAGIEANVRLVDNAQYEARLRTYEFDIVEHTHSNSLSPGAEQAFYWGAKAAETQGARNYAGVQSEAVEGALAAMQSAKTRSNLVLAAKNLDKAVLETHTLIPLFATPAQWVALNKGIRMPTQTSLFGYLPESFWRE